MNRNFLLFLMIGTALLILVIGGQQSQLNFTYTPWEINKLDNNKISVFGITLGKTTIQDANQIFSSFPVTHFKESNNKLQLLAYYHELQFGGLLADIELGYNLDDSELKKLKEAVLKQDDSGYHKLPEEIEIQLLNKTVSSLIYKPSIDYEMDIILQRFGPPESEQKLSENLSRWIYTDFGLEIIIDNLGPDTFIYSLIKSDKNQTDNIPATDETKAVVE